MNENSYETVIGLEVHAQLLTETKLFCSCRPEYGADPNTRVCPVCMGLPGALPVLNKESVTMAIMMGLALECDIAPESVFSRKNYFYPDCPKNYQISMYDKPLCGNGSLKIETDAGERTIGVERIHLEDDSGKMSHETGRGSLVDFNRCGVPLIEIVSRPDIRTGGEAAEYLMRLQQILRYLGICDGNLEEGSMRCDVNISLRRTGSGKLGTKTEIKNLNSFKAVQKGIEFEVERQRSLLERGKRVEQITNLWDQDRGRLVMMRSKEEAHDYRYFPEPDLLPLEVQGEWIEQAREMIPELPIERERRFKNEYGLSSYDCGVLCADKGVADYFEIVAKTTGLAKKSSNWVMREVMGELNNLACAIEDFPVYPENLAKLIKLVQDGTISGSAGREVFEEMIKSGGGPEEIIKRLGLEQISNSIEIESIIEEIISDHPDEVSRYREGKKKLLGFFVGQVMKKSRGKANPKLARDIIIGKLGG
ncbi:MAG: Asp-tRNA(Asn)/Glu-tRNA(Gln) amidotransferase subunit GatB [Candidatus Krumholzibacteriota bacterium]|nr:Asp-tRNA(Asn)/Glu-tRNA(Gln) amidotransferase subunit GatB [Candidatus Krumholzibacteriota bacterium]